MDDTVICKRFWVLAHENCRPLELPHATYLNQTSGGRIECEILTRSLPYWAFLGMKSNAKIHIREKTVFVCATTRQRYFSTSEKSLRWRSNAKQPWSHRRDTPSVPTSTIQVGSGARATVKREVVSAGAGSPQNRPRGGRRLGPRGAGAADGPRGVGAGDRRW